ncbi:MAG: peptide-N4-asparagine amidase, partial [Trebonia sp.]
VVLDITGTEQGTQYDRLLNVYDGATQIFLGVTPEPTAAGITWHVQKDVTGYLPIMTGTQTFATTIDNYTNSVDNGIPVVTAKLLFYPAGGGYAPARAASLADPSLAGDAVNETGPASPATAPGVPNDIVPIVPSGDSNDFNTVNTGQTLSAPVTLPDNITTATLDLYAVGQINDEFWWGLNPAFREIEVSIDGKPAGAVWPYPYVYTGGVNPLIWRPLTGLHTEDIPSYRIDLTPFAGLLSGTGPHTISLDVVNNNGYWLAGGDLMLTGGGAPVTGSVTRDTLSFPDSSSVTSTSALGGATGTPVTSESASDSYAISGTVTRGGRSYADTLNQSLQFGNDQTNVDPACTTTCYQWAHQETTSSASEAITGPGVHVDRTDKSSYTIDAPNGYQQNSSGSDFFLPASVTQQLTDVAAQGWYRTTLSESIMGYGALEEDNSVHTIANGETTGTVTQVDGGDTYVRTITTRGGQIVSDIAG